MRGLWQFMRDVFGLSLGSSGLVHVGTFTVRQSGGVAGIDEARISAAANQAVFQGMVSGGGGEVLLATRDAYTIVLDRAGNGFRVCTSPGLSTATLQNVANELTVQSGAAIGWSSTADAGGTPDLTLYRDAANTLAQRNGTAAQTINVYNTYTDASNYERAFARWTSNVAEFGTDAVGTGVHRACRIQGNGIVFTSPTTQRWEILSTGHFQAIVDNTYDIGASGANRPRTIYVGSSVKCSGDIHAYSGTAIPAGGTAGAGLRVSSTSNFGVFFGSGAPTLAAAQGSLYLRSDGSSTSTRLYVNTDGGTTWTNVTTAA